MPLPIDIEDTFAEAFEGIFCRVIVTADDAETLRRAAEDATATPSIVIGRVEGGIEKWVNKRETPDKRNGVILQFWGRIDSEEYSKSLKKFETEISYRIRQDILVKPLTAVFDAISSAEGRLDMMERVGHCGDGYEWIEKRWDREVIVVPTMIPDFIIERRLGYSHGVMGANLWFFCRNKRSMKEAGRKAIQAIAKVTGVITPFDVCSAGSKTETNFPWIGPTTNQAYCPSLRNKIGDESKVPKDVKYIPEIVINGISMSAVKEAMKRGILAARKVNGVVKISAGNYEGKLGKYKIYLRELYP